MLFEPLNQFLITALGGIMQDRFTVFVFCVDVQPLFNQPLNQFQSSILGGIMQGSSILSVFCFDVCAVFN